MVAVKQKFVYFPDGRVDTAAWLQRVQKHHHLKNTHIIEKACQFAQAACEGLTTFYGQPCIEQGLEMAEILLDLKLDAETAAAGIITSASLHTHITIETIAKELDDPVAKLVQSFSHMNSINQLANITQRDQIQIDRLRKTFLAMVADIRVVLIKLAERTCIMRGIKNINSSERKRLAQETMDIYAPLANRLGIGQLKWELEDIAFHYIEPDTYKTIAKFLSERRITREQYIQEIISNLSEQLKNANIRTELSGRAKHIYSIFSKMQRKHIALENIYDYSAVRILVPTIADCYTALSIVHSTWEHIPEEFDDYIANPKSNGYRSIHTAVAGPDGRNMEIQIRTYDMHDEAEHGVAAHWLYKENAPQESGYESKITFLRQLLAWHHDVAQDKSINDAFNKELLEDRIYVFTPAGDILDLPIGATPLDFAYHIHSGLGHRCRGAKINGHIAQLTTALKTGDRIEILTTQHGAPSRDWLNKDTGYIKTARARAKIMQWFKQQDVSQYIEAGKQMIEREFTRAGLQHPNLQKMASRFNYKDENSLLAALGHGKIRITQLLQVYSHENSAANEAVPNQFISTKKVAAHASGLQVEGTNDLLTRIARCCKPIPGDPIIGYITQGRGVSIHRKNCNNISHLTYENQNRFIDVSWDNKHLGNYFVDLQIRAYGRADLLKDISSTLTHLKIDLITLNSTFSKNNNMIFITMTIQIHDLAQHQHLLTHLHQLPNIIEIKRMRL